MARSARPATDQTEAANEPPKKTPRKQARDLSKLAMETLESILKGGGGDAAKIAAAREVLDRAYGKSRPNEKRAASKKVTVVIRRFGDEGPSDEAAADRASTSSRD